jgi:hypothetical protein
VQGKHRDYEPFEMGENMEADLGLFEAAVKPTKVQLDFAAIANIIVVLDGSNQEATCRQMGNEISGQLSSTRHTIEKEISADHILQLAHDQSSGLIVLPVPCGEDIGKLRSQSLGSITDTLLQTSEIPLFCVRDPLEPSHLAAVFEQILVTLSRQDHCSASALGWAFRLASPRTRINILELADRTSIQEAHRLLQGKGESSSIEEAAIGRAVTSRLGGLIGAAQNRAQSVGLPLHVDFRLGNPTKETLEMAETIKSELIIVARPEDHTAAGYHLAEDILLATGKCVLVI